MNILRVRGIYEAVEFLFEVQGLSFGKYQVRGVRCQANKVYKRLAHMSTCLRVYMST